MSLSSRAWLNRLPSGCCDEGEQAPRVDRPPFTLRYATSCSLPATQGQRSTERPDMGQALTFRYNLVNLRGCLIDWCTRSPNSARYDPTVLINEAYLRRRVREPASRVGSSKPQRSLCNLCDSSRRSQARLVHTLCHEACK